MRKKPFKIAMLAVAVLILLMGCNLPQGGGTTTQESLPTSTTGVEPSPTTPGEVTPAIPTSTNPPLPPTATVPPTAEISDPTSTPTESTSNEPSCTVLQDLNLRTGPGIAYRPPIRALPAETTLVPLGYNPVGVPGGPWVQVRDASTGEVGWVSAGDQFVRCTIDLTGLPPVSVPTPAPPAPPETNNSTPDGTFPPNFVWEADFNDEYFVRFNVYDTNSGGTNDGDGIAEVSFQVLDENGNQVYQRTERASGYCIFGGGEPECNPWLMEDFRYKWVSGGDPVEPGRYQLLIVVIATSGDQGNWNYDIDLDIPE